MSVESRFKLNPNDQARTNETQAKILNVSAILFAATGFEATSIRDIAKEAGVKHQIIAYHFGSKEDLWHTLLIYLAQEMRENTNLENIKFDEENPRESFKNALKDMISYYAHKPELIRIITHESFNASSRVNFIMKHIQGYFDMSSAFLSEAQKYNLLPDVPHQYLVPLFNGALTVRFINPLLQDVLSVDAHELEDIIENHTNALMAFLLKPA